MPRKTATNSRTNTSTKEWDPKFSIPDAINCSPKDNFTIIPNNVLKNSELSLKAKGLLTLLLSNQDGVWHSYITHIIKQSTDGETAVRSGLAELEEHNYLQRVRYRDIPTKTLRGSFWAYTGHQGEFKLDCAFKRLQALGLEPVQMSREINSQNPTLWKPRSGEPKGGKPRTNNTNPNNTNSKNIKVYLREKNGAAMGGDCRPFEDRNEDSLEKNGSSPLNESELSIENKNISTTNNPNSHKGNNTATGGKLPSTDKRINDLLQSGKITVGDLLAPGEPLIVSNESPPPIASEAPVPSPAPTPSSVVANTDGAANTPLPADCNRVYQRWLGKAGHIHKPRLTASLAKALAPRVKALGPVRIMRAIDRYAEVYGNAAFYYKHDWTLVNFVKQRNGVPRFVEGVDDQYDGDIWRDYCRQTQRPSNNSSRSNGNGNGANGARNNGHHANTTITASPEALINKRFSGVLADAFTRDCFHPALTMTDLDKGGEAGVVKALIERYERIDLDWEHLPRSQQTVTDLGPMTVLERFVEWLGDQSWVTNRRPSMFTNEALYTQFYRGYREGLLGYVE